MMLAVATLLFLSAAATPVPEVERFAIVVGFNRSSDPSNSPLSYGDDDAFRAFELLERVIPANNIALLTEPDSQSLQLFPVLANRAVSPTKARLRLAIVQLSQMARMARRAGKRVEVFFFYSGHGNVERGSGYLEIVDGRIGPEVLEAEVIRPFGDATVHLVIDSCNSYYLLNARGPGGLRYRASTPTTEPFFSRNPNVGVFLSTSAATEVFEWSDLQSGVFSHEVRSGLLGGADIDQDGRVSYGELELFVHTANRSIENERYKPRVFVRPPKGDSNETLLAIPEFNRITLPTPGRYAFEDHRGLRVADLNTRIPGVVVSLPGASGQQFFVKYFAPNGSHVAVRELKVRTSTSAVLAAGFDKDAPVATRGAEGLIFKRLFEDPFPPEDPPALWLHDRAIDLQVSRWVHGPVVALGLESGHLRGVTIVPTVLMGYRMARDRWAFDAAFEIAVTPQVAIGPSRFSLRRLGIRMGPRYDIPLGEAQTWALTTGPLVGAAWEHQSFADGQDLDATSGLWGWRFGALVLPLEIIQLGAELHGGGRVSSIEGRVQNRFVAGLMLVSHLMP